MWNKQQKKSSINLSQLLKSQMSILCYGFVLRVLYLMYNFGFNYEAACPTEKLLKQLFPFKQLST